MRKWCVLAGVILCSTCRVFAQCKLDGPNNVDAPKRITIRETCEFVLFPEESAFFVLDDAVSDVKVLLDAERPKGELPGNLIATVELLNADGSGISADKLHMNTQGMHSRSSIAFSFPKARRLGFKVTDQVNRTKLFITVLRKSDLDFVPLFQRISPQPIALAESLEGVLRPFEDYYRSIKLQRGAYKVILDASTVKGENTNLQITIQLLRGDGSGDDSLLNLNSIGTSDRMSHGFSVPQESTWILHIVSQNPDHAYQIKARVVSSDE